MNSLSHLYVAAHIDEMLNQSANERLARTSASIAPMTRVSSSWLVSATNGALKSVWSILTGPAERPMFATGSGQPSVILPTLSDYPYRG
jgi:hypothetical protein